MKMDQIAYYCHDLYAETLLKEFLGLEHAPWILDRVEASSTIRNFITPIVNFAELQFNYDLGVEVEILRYVDDSPSWHEKNPLRNHKSFQSHIGVHLDDDEAFPDHKVANYDLVQETFTYKHTSKYLTDPSSPGFGRKFHYRIYEISPGSYIKFIRRIHP